MVMGTVAAPGGSRNYESILGYKLSKAEIEHIAKLEGDGKLGLYTKAQLDKIVKEFRNAGKTAEAAQQLRETNAIAERRARGEEDKPSAESQQKKLRDAGIRGGFTAENAEEAPESPQPVEAPKPPEPITPLPTTVPDSQPVRAYTSTGGRIDVSPAGTGAYEPETTQELLAKAEEARTFAALNVAELESEQVAAYQKAYDEAVQQGKPVNQAKALAGRAAKSVGAEVLSSAKDVGGYVGGVAGELGGEVGQGIKHVERGFIEGRRADIKRATDSLARSAHGEGLPADVQARREAGKGAYAARKAGDYSKADTLARRAYTSGSRASDRNRKTGEGARSKGTGQPSGRWGSSATAHARGYGSRGSTSGSRRSSVRRGPTSSKRKRTASRNPAAPSNRRGGRDPQHDVRELDVRTGSYYTPTGMNGQLDAAGVIRASDGKGVGFLDASTGEVFEYEKGMPEYVGTLDARTGAVAPKIRPSVSAHIWAAVDELEKDSRPPTAKEIELIRMGTQPGSPISSPPILPTRMRV